MYLRNGLRVRLLIYQITTITMKKRFHNLLTKSTCPTSGSLKRSISPQLFILSESEKLLSSSELVRFAYTCSKKHRFFTCVFEPQRFFHTARTLHTRIFKFKVNEIIRTCKTFQFKFISCFQFGKILERSYLISNSIS